MASRISKGRQEKKGTLGLEICAVIISFLLLQERWRQGTSWWWDGHHHTIAAVSIDLGFLVYKSGVRFWCRAAGFAPQPSYNMRCHIW